MTGPGQVQHTTTLATGRFWRWIGRREHRAREVGDAYMKSPPRRIYATRGKTRRGCHLELWSAAACCRFGSSQLAGGEFFPRLKSRRASSQGRKAAACCRTPKLRTPAQAAQDAVEEPGLPQFALRAPALVDRVPSRGEAAPRPYFVASEIVTGYTGAQMQFPSADGSGRKTQAVR